MQRVPNDAMEGVYTDLIAADALLDESEVFLIREDFDDEDPNIVVGDLTKANFTGAADFVTAGWVVATGADGKPFASANAEEVTPADAVNLPQNIHGVGMLDAAGNLIAVSKLPTVLTVSFAGQPIIISPRFKLGESSSQSTVVSIE